MVSLLIECLRLYLDIRTRYSGVDLALVVTWPGPGATDEAFEPITGN